jgi:tripartite-type tricarboxylate transporter receptor subunit TctC
MEDPMRWTGLAALAVMSSLSIAHAAETAYPVRPVRIVTSVPGGANDFTARIIAQGISEPLGQNVVVENRSVSVMGELVAHAPADGYTLLVTGDDFWITPLFHKPPYDPENDFAPITQTISSPLLLVVHPSLPVKTTAELIALAKAHPGKLDYSASLIGAEPHLAAEMFKSMAKVNVVMIKYSGGGPAIFGVIAGEVQLTFGTAAATAPHVKAGKLRALAVTSSKPSALLPDIPTIDATVPGYNIGLVGGMFAPAGTPEAIVNQLNREIVRLLRRDDIKAKFFASGVEAVTSMPDELRATMKSDVVRTAKLIRDANIKGE